MMTKAVMARAMPMNIRPDLMPLSRRLVRWWWWMGGLAGW
jgi:hypothetical protein